MLKSFLLQYLSFLRSLCYEFFWFKVSHHIPSLCSESKSLHANGFLYTDPAIFWFLLENVKKAEIPVFLCLSFCQALEYDLFSEHRYKNKNNPLYVLPLLQKTTPEIPALNRKRKKRNGKDCLGRPAWEGSRLGLVLRGGPRRAKRQARGPLAAL